MFTVIFGERPTGKGIINDQNKIAITHYNTTQLQDHVLQYISNAHPPLPNTTYIQNTTYNTYHHYSHKFMKPHK